MAVRTGDGGARTRTAPRGCVAGTVPLKIEWSVPLCSFGEQEGRLEELLVSAPGRSAAGKPHQLPTFVQLFGGNSGGQRCRPWASVRSFDARLALFSNITNDHDSPILKPATVISFVDRCSLGSPSPSPSRPATCQFLEPHTPPSQSSSNYLSLLSPTMSNIPSLANPAQYHRTP